VGLWGASELDGDLAVENSLSVQLGDGTLGLSGGREGNEGVADGARGAGVGWDGRGLADEANMLALGREIAWGCTYTK
jgi:hypothetical protein